MEYKDIILIEKPKGITSYDVIRVLKKANGKIKMGHSGTLDPLASGLLIIGVKKGTKKLKYYIKLPKVYEVSILFGKKTATGDLEGKILEQKKIPALCEKKLRSIVSNLKGKIILPVPVFSAIKIKGQPLYKSARRGEKIIPPKKEMEIFWIKWKSLQKKEDFYELKLELKVASGTYIRSIAEEIGAKMNLPATISELRRTSIGDFNIKDAEKLPIEKI